MPGPDLGGECLVRDGEILFHQVTTKLVNEHYVPIAHLTPPELDPATALCIGCAENAEQPRR